MSHRVATSITRAAGASSGASSIIRRIAPSVGCSSSIINSPNITQYLSCRASSAAVRLPAITSWPSISSRRGIHYSTPRLQDDAAVSSEPKPEGEDSECPTWQNPIHHAAPTGKVFEEDFEPGEEVPVIPLPPFEDPENPGATLAAPHLHELAEEITQLTMVEMVELVDRVGDHFDLGDDDFEDDGGDEGGAAVEEVKEEKTIFDLKLTGFDAKSKIKVIKAIRGMTSLGLKEAKELVEGAPTTVKKDIKMEEAEELKATIEAVGGTVEIV